MKISEIYFNHNTSGATTDALNLRKNGTGQPITGPQWQDGRAPKPVAYARSEIAKAKKVTIKVRLSGGPKNQTRRIRAVFPFKKKEYGKGSELAMPLVSAMGDAFGRAMVGDTHPLGEVAEQTVQFDASGKSALIEFTLKHHELDKVAVGYRELFWVWQTVEKGRWRGFATTNHKVYFVLGMPQGPWRPSDAGATNKQLPWIDALAVACKWAGGATTVDQVAEKITRAVNQIASVKYESTADFSKGDSYNLTHFLHALKSNKPFEMNCIDCAEAVVTLSNLLGAGLYVATFRRVNTGLILPLGGKPDYWYTVKRQLFGQTLHETDPAYHPGDWAKSSWATHVIAIDGPTLSMNSRVYDACLELNKGSESQPVKAGAVRQRLLPVKMKFGAIDQKGTYRYYLLDHEKERESVTARGKPQTVKGDEPRRRPVI